MPFLSLCCTSSRSSENEKETRRARIVPILDPSAYNPHHHRQNSYSNEHSELPPPRYEDVTTSVSLHAAPVLVANEKESNVVRVVDVGRHSQTTEERNAEERSRSVNTQQPPIEEVTVTITGAAAQFEGSDRSSIISIPSTQLTGLGSSYTGTTTLRGDATGRTSGDHSSGRFSETGTLNELDTSRPPSYYACNQQRRSRSSSPGTASDADSVWRHPVMREEWFEHLRGTRGEGEWRR